MEALAARHTTDFSLEELADRLGAVYELDEMTFASYGLDETQIVQLRRWAAAWESDIRNRIATGEAEPAGASNPVWDLDEK